jgi:hypothetical protein
MLWITLKELPQKSNTFMRPTNILILLAICTVAQAQTDEIKKWIHTEEKYTVSAGKSVAIQNSFPKGGGQYTDANGMKYGYVVFWSRILNESTSPVELSIKFPATPFKIFPKPDSHIKLFLPPDTMKMAKVPMFDYGLTNIPSFLDAGFNKPTAFQRRIDPQAECLFYVLVPLHYAQGSTGGSARAALVLKGQELSFKISISPDVKDVLIPCGQLVFKN